MIKKTVSLVALTAISYLTFALPASAGPILQNYSQKITSFGHYIYDTSSGLDWLDLTETKGQSLGDVSTRLETGQDLYGWRLATKFDFAMLTMKRAYYDNPDFNYGDASSASDFWIRLSTYMNNTPGPYQLGTVQYTPGYSFAIKGLIADPVDGLTVGVVFKEDYDIIKSANFGPYDRPYYFAQFEPDGFYLVRTHVSESSAFVLLAIGLMGIRSRRRRLQN